MRLESARYIATVRGREVALTMMETAIHQFLMSHAGAVYFADRLSAELADDGKSSVDSARAHIRRLHQKLEEHPENPRIIVTMGRKGYFFQD